MKRSLLLVVMLMTFATITGCGGSGVEWFPDGRQPREFSFATQNGVTTNTQLASENVSLGGNLYSAVITVYNGEFSLDNGTNWVSGTGTLKAGGGTLRLRHWTASTPKTSVVTTVDIAGRRATFTSITGDSTIPSIQKTIETFGTFSSVSKIQFTLTLPNKGYLVTDSSGSPVNSKAIQFTTNPTDQKVTYVDQTVTLNLSYTPAIKKGAIMTMITLFPVGTDTTAIKPADFPITSVVLKNGATDIPSGVGDVRVQP